MGSVELLTEHVWTLMSAFQKFTIVRLHNIASIMMEASTVYRNDCLTLEGVVVEILDVRSVFRGHF